MNSRESRSLHHGTVRARGTLPVVLSLLLGLVLTAVLVRGLWQQENQTWEQRVQVETKYLSVAILEWMESSYAPLAGLAGLLESAELVDETVFLNTLDNLESRASGSFFQQVGLLRQLGTHWGVVYKSSDPGRSLLTSPAHVADAAILTEALLAAADRPNEWTMSNPITTQRGGKVVVINLALTGKPDYVLSGVLDTDKLIGNLLDARATKGLYLTVKIERATDNRHSELFARRPTEPTYLTTTSSGSTAGVRLVMDWAVTSEFAGGHDRQTIIAIALAGVVLSFLGAWLVSLQLSEAHKVRTQVQSITSSLKQERMYLERVLELSPVGIMLVVGGVVRYLNPSGEKLLNVKPGQPIEAAYVDHSQHDQLRAELEPPDQRALIAVPAQFYAADRSVRDMLLTLAKIDYDGEAALMGWVVDVTLLKNAERSMLEALEQAEEASLAKSNFLANMSHEIRTPMNAIIGLTGLALRDPTTPRQRDYLVKIQSSSQHLLRLINDILDFSKIESGKLDMESVPFELESVVTNVLGVVTEKAGAKNLELLCQMDSNLPPVLVGDPLRLGQVLINYVNNAIKFTDTGQVILSVTLKSLLDGQALVHFAVSDTGIGLSDAQMARLFQSFEQADTSITRQYGGTGLGLAISKSLATMMGGTVGVSSVVGEGSTFWFTACLGVAAQSSASPPMDITLRGMRILVVDDHAIAAELLCTQLSAMGLVACSVHSGNTAVEEIQRSAAAGQPYGFALIDYIMPGMDGLQTVQAIRALPTPPAMLLMAVYTDTELMQRAEKLGLSEVLAKPVFGSVLLDSLMRACGTAPASPHSRLPALAIGLEPRLETIWGARILLVEDNDINQQVANEMLSSVGFEVHIADNGQIALDAVAQQQKLGLPFDVVLMDMQMPVMDGVTAAGLLRQSYAAHELPIIAMTANAMKADRDRCLQVGMNAFVTKPIDRDGLFRALLAHISVRPGMGKPLLPAAPQPLTQEPDAQTLAARATLAALRSLASLDVDAGLRHTSHNENLYISLWQRFTASQSKLALQMEEALLVDDLATAERLAHTLKGVAANLGALDLQAGAAALEQCLRETGEPSQRLQHWEHTKHQLQSLLEELAAVPGLHTANVAVAPTALAPEATAQMIATLAELLRNNDASAVDFWQSNASQLKSSIAQAHRIEEALLAFDFEEASELLAC